MKAVIVAAGMSTRLHSLKEARGIPKCLLPVDGNTIIDRAVDNLRYCGIPYIVVVTGYRAEDIRFHLGNKVEYVNNPFYEYCNDMASLWFAKDYIDGDEFIYMHSDVVFDSQILKDLVYCSYEDVLSVDLKECDKEDMKVVLDRGKLIESSKEIPLDKADGEWIGLAKFLNSKRLFDNIEFWLEEGYLNEYDTLAFTDLARRGYIINSCYTEGGKWVEIDYPEEYEWACKQTWS